jgi:hypothetical protein
LNGLQQVVDEYEEEEWAEDTTLRDTIVDG